MSFGTDQQKTDVLQLPSFAIRRKRENSPRLFIEDAAAHSFLFPDAAIEGGPLLMEERGGDKTIRCLP